MAWVSNRKHKIEEKSTKSFRSSSKVVGLGLAGLWEFPTLVVRISSDTVTENYGQVWLQFVMTACVFPRRPLAMLWHARGPEAATHDSWLAPKCCWDCIDILNFGHHLSTSIHCWCRLRQWYSVKSNNKPSLVVMLNCHCQIYSYMDSGW